MIKNVILNLLAVASRQLMQAGLFQDLDRPITNASILQITNKSNYQLTNF